MSYAVIVTREGRNWLADVPAVPGTHTWARTLPSLDRDVREAIALTLDLAEGAEADLQLEYDYRTGDSELDREAAVLRAGRAELAGLETTVAAQTAG